MVDYRSLVNSPSFNPGVYAVRVIRLYLIESFRQNPGFGFTIYDDNQTKSEAAKSLLITTNNDWEGPYRNKRPCIKISHGNITIGTNGTMGTGAIVGVDDQLQKVSCSDLISFPLVVECLSEEDIETATLTSIVNILLTTSIKPIHSFGFQILGNPIQSDVKIFEKGTNTTFISSLILYLQKQRQYTTTLLSNQLLKQITIDLNDNPALDIKEDSK